jgi:hypothetical protein
VHRRWRTIRSRQSNLRSPGYAFADIPAEVIDEGEIHLWPMTKTDLPEAQRNIEFAEIFLTAQTAPEKLSSVCGCVAGKIA